MKDTDINSENEKQLVSSKGMFLKKATDIISGFLLGISILLIYLFGVIFGTFEDVFKTSLNYFLINSVFVLLLLAILIIFLKKKRKFFLIGIVLSLLVLLLIFGSCLSSLSF